MPIPASPRVHYYYDRLLVEHHLLFLSLSLSLLFSIKPGIIIKKTLSEQLACVSPLEKIKKMPLKKKTTTTTRVVIKPFHTGNRISSACISTLEFGDGSGATRPKNLLPHHHTDDEIEYRSNLFFPIFFKSLRCWVEKQLIHRQTFLPFGLPNGFLLPDRDNKKNYTAKKPVKGTLRSGWKMVLTAWCRLRDG